MCTSLSSPLAPLPLLPAHKTLVLATAEGTQLLLWHYQADQQRWSLLSVLKATRSIQALSWSPDGTRLAYGGDDYAVQIWDVWQGRRLGKAPQYMAPISALAWSPDGSRLASASGAQLVLTDASGALLCRDQQHQEAITTLSWSPDGLLASGDLQGSVHIWDGGTHELRASTRLRAPVQALSWSPDGLLAIATGPLVHLWAHVVDRTLATYQGHTAPVTTLCWSPDGSCLASGSQQARWDVWASTTGRPCYSVQALAPLSGLAWSPDGSQLASSCPGAGTLLWEAITGRFSAALPAVALCGGPLAWAPQVAASHWGGMLS